LRTSCFRVLDRAPPDHDANLVEDGLYLVVVETVGEQRVKTVAIVR
jgi:hypothetical protein